MQQVQAPCPNVPLLQHERGAVEAGESKLSMFAGKAIACTALDLGDL